MASKMLSKSESSLYCAETVIWEHKGLFDTEKKEKQSQGRNSKNILKKGQKQSTKALG